MNNEHDNARLISYNLPPIMSHFLAFNQVILMLNQSFDEMHTSQITKVKIHVNKVSHATRGKQLSDESI
jgi:hypothetical protein